MPPLLTVEEVTRQLRCSRTTVYRIRAGKYPDLPPLPFILLGRMLRITQHALNNWLVLLEARAIEDIYASGISTHRRDEDMEYLAGA